MFFVSTSIAIPAEDADSASAAAAKIILDDAARRVSTPNASAARLATALTPIYGAVWARVVLAAVTTDPINKLLQRLRQSSLPKGSMGD